MIASWGGVSALSSCKSSALSCPGDDVPGFHALLEQLAHLLHVGGGVLEEVLVSFAQGVEALFSSACGGEAVFGALAAAGEEEVALAAVGGEAVAFLDAETEEFGLALHVAEVFGPDVAEAVFGVYEVVAHVYVAVVLDHKSVAAGGAEGAESGLHAAPLGEGDVEELYEAFAHVAYDPLVEYVAHELAECLRGDAPGGYRASFGAGGDDGGAARWGGDGVFHDGEELHVSAHRAHELVYSAPLSGTAVVDGAQGVVLYAACGHHFEGADDAVEGGVSASVASVGVVYVLGTVDGEAYEEVVFAEEATPVGVDEQSVGLQ